MTDGRGVCLFSVKTDLLPYGAVSRLYIANASQRDAGNYTCNISESSWTTVVVHILNGIHADVQFFHPSIYKLYIDRLSLLSVCLMMELETNLILI